MYPVQNLCNGLVKSVKRIHFLLGDDPKGAYTLLSKTVLQGMEVTSFPEIRRNPLLAYLGDEARTLIKNINRLVWTHVMESTTLLSSTMHIIERARPNYIMLCDGLSLSEYLFLIHMLPTFVRGKSAFAAANPSGKTSTFKYLAHNYLKMPVPSEDVIMRTVGKALRNKFDALGYTLFRDVDNFIHWGSNRGFHRIEDAIEPLSKIAYGLYTKLRHLLKTEHKVLLLADHGYDIISENGEWKLTHGWSREKLCMSPFVPILVLG